MSQHDSLGLTSLALNRQKIARLPPRHGVLFLPLICYKDGIEFFV